MSKSNDKFIAKISLVDLVSHLKEELKQLDERLSVNGETLFKLDSVSLEANVIVSQTKESNTNEGIKFLSPGYLKEI